MNRLKNTFGKVKQWFLHVIMGSSSDKHDCKENRELIEKMPLFEGNSPMSPPSVYVGDTYNVKCKVCGMNWWQNYL